MRKLCGSLSRLAALALIVLVLAVGVIPGPRVCEATAIDIGEAATDRASQSQMSDRTIILLENAANETGMITSVEAWFAIACPAGAKVGIWYKDDSTHMTIRSVSDSLPWMAANVKQTFSVNLSVTAGDYIGMYFPTGGCYIKSAIASGKEYISLSGSALAWNHQTIYSSSGLEFSLYGTGASSSVATLDVTAGESLLTGSSARLNGNVTDAGLSTGTVTLYYGDNDGTDNVSAWDSNTQATSPSQPMGSGAFYADVSGLSEATLYYYRAKCVNGVGTSWSSGSDNFTTLTFGVLGVSGAGLISATGARLIGEVSTQGSSTGTVTVYYGDNDGAGVSGSWDNSSVVTSPSQPQGVASFYLNVYTLTTAKMYFYRAVFVNTAGTSWSPATENFTTLVGSGGPAGADGADGADGIDGAARSTP